MKKTRPKAKRTPARKTKAATNRIELGYAGLRLLQDDGIADSGHFTADRQVIGIDTAQVPADQLNTLFHELTHVIAQRFHLDLDEKLEEHLAQVFGNAWAELFLRNPNLLPFLQERIDEEAARVDGE